MPKVSSDRLFKLVKSLSKQEKRYFKLDHPPSKGKPHNYVRIFDEVDKQKEYNEEALKKKFKNEAFTKHFHIIKNRVFEAILKSLDSYHANNTIESSIRKQLHYVEILYEKLLYEDALKILQQQKAIAKKNNLYTSLLEIYHWERKVVLVHRTFTDGEKIDAFKQERFDYLDVLKNLYEYESFSDLIYSLYIKRKMRAAKKNWKPSKNTKTITCLLIQTTP